MTHEELLKKIRSRGHWRISFEPLEEQTIEPLSKCREIVEKNSIELRGWDYPHIPRRTGDDTGFEPGENFWQAWLDWPEYAHFEFWRFYQSGQFIHYREIAEDWLQDATFDNMWQQEKTKIAPGERLGVVGTTFLITEIYQFLAKLGNAGVYEKGVQVTLSLNNTKERKLYVDDYGRFPFSFDRKTISEKIDYKKVYTKEEIISQPQELARQAILYIFERFNWEPNPDIIKADQEKLLSRKA